MMLQDVTPIAMPTTDVRAISLDAFHAQRQEVLQAWPTGAAVNLDDAVAYQRQIEPRKRFSNVLREAAARRAMLIQPRAGVALIEDHVRLLKYLENEGRPPPRPPPAATPADCG